MRNILLCIMVLISIVSNAQNTSEYIGVEDEYIVNVESSKSSLYIKAMAWVSSNDPDRIIKVETGDKECGTIIVTITKRLPKKDSVCVYSEVIVQMNAKIDCRDNKYRIGFSNFTANVSADKSVNTDYLTASQLELMIKELEMIARLSETRFNEKTIWGFDGIVSSIQHYEGIIENYKAEISDSDTSTKKGRKEISKREKWISVNQEYLSYFDYILKGFGNAVSDAVKSLSKSMNTTDDF